MAGKSLLETGCGRGGGLHYIASKMTPEYSVGVDISDSQVGFLSLLKVSKYRYASVRTTGSQTKL
jgi:cyclopropane fatty-acyl-phospholipid synthase-like methyltransferase